MDGDLIMTEPYTNAPTQINRSVSSNKDIQSSLTKGDMWNWKKEIRVQSKQ